MYHRSSRLVARSHLLPVVVEVSEIPPLLTRRIALGRNRRLTRQPHQQRTYSKGTNSLVQAAKARARATAVRPNDHHQLPHRGKTVQPVTLCSAPNLAKSPQRPTKIVGGSDVAVRQRHRTRRLPPPAATPRNGRDHDRLVMLCRPTGCPAGRPPRLAPRTPWTPKSASTTGAPAPAGLAGWRRYRAGDAWWPVGRARPVAGLPGGE